MTHVQGLAELERRWGAIPKRVRAAAEAALEEQAERITGEMRQLAPGAARRRVARSIGWTWGAAPAGAMTIGDAGGRDYGTMRVTIHAGGAGTQVFNARGAAFDLAKLHEFGTRNMPANPFFYPVWRLRRRSVKLRIGKAIRDAIRQG